MTEGVYFYGDAPSDGGDQFGYDLNATVYYLPGTSGWDTFGGGNPKAFWVLPTPIILNGDSSIELRTNAFGFIISWATNSSVVVEANTNWANPVWTTVGTNTLNNGSCYFSDPDWTNYPSRFYRIRSP